MRTLHKTILLAIALLFGWEIFKVVLSGVVQYVGMNAEQFAALSYYVLLPISILIIPAIVAISITKKYWQLANTERMAITVSVIAVLVLFNIISPLAMQQFVAIPFAIVQVAIATTTFLLALYVTKKFVITKTA